MYEHNKKWLDKNNDDACGDRTSAQGALSSCNTRATRNAKAMGKELDVSQPVVIFKGEFEPQHATEPRDRFSLHSDDVSVLERAAH